MPSITKIPFEVKLMSESLAGKSYETTKESNKFIVIHNMTGTSKSSLDYWNSGSNGQYTSAHYCVDDKAIWQTLKDSWVGHHCGKPIHWAGLKGCNNNTSIGIEIADMLCDQKKAVDNAIDVARYLAKKYNIPYENIVRHKDVSNTDCPAWIESHNLWDYFKKEVQRRDSERIDLCFDPSSAISGDVSPGNNGNTSSETSGTQTLPNFDNREDWTNLKEIKGVALICMPPFHFTTLKDKDKKWGEDKYKKEFHYLYDTNWKESKEKKLIAKSLQENNRHTYIERALYNNKAEKFILSVGMFLPPMLDDYPTYEKKLIDNIGKIIYENKLKTKDLWREFDFNRAPSPFMYLDREQWKKFLREIDKQVKWRYENFGEPLKPEKDPSQDGEDYSKIKNNIGKKSVTSRYCLLRANPSMTSQIIKALEKDEPLTIIDADTRGYYKVKLTDDNNQEGWLIAKSVGINEKKSNKKSASIIMAKDKKVPQPEITPTMTHDQYLKWKDLTDPKLIDELVDECEPYDKGLKEIIDSSIKDDDRLKSLNKQIDTRKDNTINYLVTEGSPGDSGHCVKPSAELSMMFKPTGSTKVDPVYPDLIVPPNYAPTEYNINSQNPIPMSTLEDNSIIKDSKDFDNDQFTFDYELLNDKKKVSKGKPINYLDPYPYDDKIIELEKHHPKIKIDEIEARLYESNHPGDPSAQPMAKNFALVYDAMLKQSSNIEKRLVKIENTLSTILRNQGRIGSRININCVYYGGQDSFGKYKTIRCLCDDRIHDAGSVTLDQCLSCTRYEPILGQVYDILDDTGMNGTVFLDNMQMSYMHLDDLKNLNRVEKRATSNKYADVNKEIEKPESQFKKWEEIDKQAYIKKLKEKITDEKELEKKIKEIKQEDYSFKMNWYEQDLEAQEPDVKPYPLEGIKARYKKINVGNKSADSQNDNEISILDENTDQDAIKDIVDLDKINNGEWVDTREKADTFETNGYSSEDYYFEGYNIVRASSLGNSVGGVFGAEARTKIVEKAKEIVQLHAEGKAGYSWSPRTVDDSNRLIGSNSFLSNVPMYDCSSLVSCCYKYAGLNSMYNSNTNGQIKRLVGKNMPEQFWLANEEGLKKALPGDLIYTTLGQVTIEESYLGNFILTEHVMIYIGDNKIAHASTGKRPVPKQIRIDDVNGQLKPYNFFVRPYDLIEADKKAQESSNSGNSVSMVNGVVTVNGKQYNTLATIKGAVCTPYHASSFMGGGSTYAMTGRKYLDVLTNSTITVPSESVGRNQVKYCASHNLPYGTQLYFPKLQEKGLGDGIVMVVDTGGHVFDFDINMTDSQANKFGGKQNLDAYVLKWGEDKTIAPSYRKAASWYNTATRKVLSTAWRNYISKGGKLIKFHKFNNDDANANLNSSLSPID